MRVTAHLTPDAWRAALAALPVACRDPYFGPDYHALHTAQGDGEPTCTLIEDGPAVLLVPGLRVPIEGHPGCYDLQTCNGYGGPLASPEADEAFLARAWAAWREAMVTAGIVAGFFRLLPLLDQAPWLPPDADIVPNRETVYVDLTAGLEATWRTADARHRNMVNRGRREGTQARWDAPEDWEDFPGFYIAAMDRLHAPPSLRFSAPYFAALRALPGARLSAVRDAAGLVAAAVFLHGPRWSHYHVSARRPDAPNYATNVLLQAGLEQAAASGTVGLHLGGGATPAPDDPLLRFKRSLGGTSQRFVVARVVTDPVRFRGLLDAWTARTGLRPSWLLGYRQPGPVVAVADTPATT
jgi:hypothetical protein